MIGVLSGSWFAKDALRQWINRDPLGRAPRPLTVIFADGESAKAWSANYPSGPAETIHLPFCAGAFDTSALGVAEAQALLLTAIDYASTVGDRVTSGRERMVC